MQTINCVNINVPSNDKNIFHNFLFFFKKKNLKIITKKKRKLLLSFFPFFNFSKQLIFFKKN
jgi:hypothetical protein